LQQSLESLQETAVCKPSGRDNYSRWLWRQHKQVNANADTHTNPALADLSFGATGGDHLEPFVEPVARSNSSASARHRLGEWSD
jgi:hypothetical protein